MVILLASLELVVWMRKTDEGKQELKPTPSGGLIKASN
jgi:hypothetical protein